MWYVVHTMAGLEQKCMQQCQQYVDQADYSEMFIPLYMAKKHFRKEWHDVEKPLFPGCFFVETYAEAYIISHSCMLYGQQWKDLS